MEHEQVRDSVKQGSEGSNQHGVNETYHSDAVEARVGNVDLVERLKNEIRRVRDSQVVPQDTSADSTITGEANDVLPKNGRGRPVGTKTAKQLREMKVFVPEAVDIDEILRQNPWFYTKAKQKADSHWEPNSTVMKSKRLDRSKLLWVLSQIDRFETEHQDEEYAPIAAKYWLKRLGKQYALYLRFLEQAHVIEVDHHYTNGYDEKRGRERDSKTKGYRITGRYHSLLKEHAITVDFPKSEKAFLKFTETDAFFEDLVFDHVGARKYVESLFRNSVTIDENGEEVISRKQYRIISHMTRTLKKFENKDFRVKRDLTSFRASSVITQMNSALRPFIYWKAKTLYSIDLKNSQPLLLSLLLQAVSGNGCITDSDGIPTDSIPFSLHIPSFSSNKISNIDTKEATGGCMSYRICFSENKSAEYVSKTKIFVTLMSMGILQRDGLVNEIISVKAIKTKADIKRSEKRKAEVQKFFELCVHGKMYEHIMEIHNAKEDVEKLNRDEIKKAFIIYLFSKNYAPNEVIKPIMIEHFPFIHFLIKKLKKDDHTVLPVLLQCMESHVFLDVVARRLSELQIPFCTLHDSIITTEENITVARQVIMDAFAHEYGVQPNLEVTCWQDETYNASPAIFESVCMSNAEDEQSALGSSVVEAPTATQIDSESVYTTEAIDEPSKLRSPAVEPPRAFENIQDQDALRTTPALSQTPSNDHEYYMDEEDFPKSEVEYWQMIESLIQAEKEARATGDVDGASQYQGCISALRNAKLRLVLKPFTTEAMAKRRASLN